MVYNFLDKKSATQEATGINSDEVSDNKQLTKELHRPILPNLLNIKYICPFRKIFGMLIWQIWN